MPFYVVCCGNGDGDDEGGGSYGGGGHNPTPFCVAVLPRRFAYCFCNSFSDFILLAERVLP